MTRWFWLGMALGLGAGAVATLTQCPWERCLAPGLYLAPLPQPQAERAL